MVFWGGHTNSYEKRSERQGRKGKIHPFNAEFQRIARRDKKAFFRDQCKEIEGNNRMRTIRDLIKKIRDTKGTFLSKIGTIKDRKGKWVYLSFSPLPITSLFSAICKASSDSHFAFLHFFFLGMVLITDSCTVSQTSVHSSSGTLSIRSNPLNLFVTFSV